MNPCKDNIARAARHLVPALLASFVLVSCGGGGGGSAPAGTTVISGIVSDEAIAGATVTATSVDSGVVLGSATTAANGSFTLNAKTAQIGTGYTLNSSGGTMNGLTFNGNLSAIYPATANTQQSNLTLITSALTEAANSTPQFSGTILQKHEAIKVDAIARGVINPDYFLVEPSGTQMAALRNQALLTGVSATTGALAQIFSVTPTPGGCGVSDTTCTKDVSHFGESLSMSFQGATVSAPAGALSSCRVVASYDATMQTMTVGFENIPSTTANSTPQFICQITDNVTLTLPSSTAQAPDACLAPPNSAPPKVATSIPNCVTIGSGMTPSYFVDGGDGYNHRTDKNTHSSKPVLGHQVKLSRSFGAVLNASATPSSGAAQNQWVGKNAVIFVHGYTLGGGFGGDDGTWGVLPKLVTDDPSFIALNFQWKTDASYLTVAAELAKTVDYAYLSTGKKVHIVAHSFGGVLSRAMLQNLNGLTSGSAAKVATLTTVGTPHSGIVQGGALTVEGRTLPEGWGSLAPGILCGQISCYQSGLDANIAQWAKNDLAPNGGVIPMRGYINARLADTATYPFPSGLKVNVLIGQIFNNLSHIFMDGDYLISYYGQRFVPQTGRNALLSDSLIGGATVTERILGLAIGVNAFPGDPVGNIAITSYMSGPTTPTPNFIGYKHSALVGVQPYKLEVNVPADCGTAVTCQHDTWINLNEFLHANVTPQALPVVTLTASPSSIANGATSTLSWSSTNSTSCTSSGGGGTGTAGSFTTPSLTTTTTYTVTCTGTGGTASQSATVTVAGALAPTVTLTASPSSIANGATSTLNWSSTNSTSCTSSGGGGTGTAGSFTTPSLTTTTTYTVTCTGAGGTASQSATITVAGSPAPTSKLNDTGITASQCYQAGSDVLVACGSAGAIALNNAQDGMAGRDANTATNSNTDGKLGFSFASVPAAGSDPGGCVQDNVTGLMWENKTTDGGLRDWTKTYTNYSATYNPSSLYGTSTDASGFVTAVNATNLCGYSDWRLPTADELQSIVDYGVASPGPTIDATSFPNTQDKEFWSASPNVGYSNFAWYVGFGDGYVDYVSLRHGGNFVRLVRAGQSPTPPRYTVSADGQEVTDNQTKLIWRRCSEGMSWNGTTCTGTASTVRHNAALQLAATQASSTGIAWRLPNVKELSSIADKSLSNPAIDSTAFPATPVMWFWSASPGVGSSGYAWGVNFGDGSVYSDGGRGVNGYRSGSGDVRLVRAGQ